MWDLGCYGKGCGFYWMMESVGEFLSRGVIELFWFLF